MEELYLDLLRAKVAEAIAKLKSQGQDELFNWIQTYLKTCSHFTEAESYEVTLIALAPYLNRSVPMVVITRAHVRHMKQKFFEVDQPWRAYHELMASALQRGWNHTSDRDQLTDTLQDFTRRRSFIATTKSVLATILCLSIGELEIAAKENTSSTTSSER